MTACPGVFIGKTQHPAYFSHWAGDIRFVNQDDIPAGIWSY